MGIVSIRNSNHYGIAGYYAKMACKEGLMGFSCTNSEAIMVPTNGRKAMLGSNLIACAFPAEPYDFFFDASTTVVTRGKPEMHNKMEKPLPGGWALVVPALASKVEGASNKLLFIVPTCGTFAKKPPKSLDLGGFSTSGGQGRFGLFYFEPKWCLEKLEKYVKLGVDRNMKFESIIKSMTLGSNMRTVFFVRGYALRAL